MFHVCFMQWRTEGISILFFDNSYQNHGLTDSQYHGNRAFERK